MRFHRPTIAGLVCTFALGTMSISGAMAEPGGCMKYGAAGAVGGHMVGRGHAVAGAAAGCTTGMVRRHEARKKARQQAATQNQGSQDAANKSAPKNGDAPHTR